jgi:DNA-binding NarL/FixJ family response regulator
MTLRIGIADDQDLVRIGFQMILDGEEDMEVVGTATNGHAAVELARAQRPDVMLMDIRMPVLDGLEATRRITTELEAVRVLILTTFDTDGYVAEAIRVGASGFLLKTCTPEQLIAGVQIVGAGDALLAPEVTRRLLDRFAAESLTPPAPPPGFDELTERERDVFGLLAEGLSNQEIAEKLFVSQSTVKTHVAHVLLKLGLRDRVQAVVLAYRSGTVPSGPETPAQPGG